MGVRGKSKAVLRTEGQEAHRREGDVKMEAEIGMMQYKLRNAQDCWLSPDARREAQNKFSLRPFTRNQSCQHLDFGLLDSTL